MTQAKGSCSTKRTTLVTILLLLLIPVRMTHKVIFVSGVPPMIDTYVY